MTHPHLKTILARIDALLSRQDRVIVAIEGSCGSGKTTLAALLAKHRDCNVFHMDDFFLRPHQRTPERFAQPGGNVDYERFREEISRRSFSEDGCLPNRRCLCLTSRREVLTLAQNLRYTSL